MGADMIAPKPKRHWVLKGLLAFFLVVLCVGFALHRLADTALLPAPYRSSRTFSTEPIRYEFGEHGPRLAIPRNVVDGPRLPGRVDSVLLFVLVPDIEGRTRENAAEFKRLGPGSRFTSVLLSKNKGGVRDIERFTQIYESDHPSHRIESLGTWNGLVGRRQVPPDSAIGARWRESYRAYDGDRVVTGIVCDGDGTVPSPGCNMFFEFEGLIIQADFRKAFLPDWALIRGNLESKLRSWWSAP